MKTKLILTLASMLFFVTGLRAATPYAVYCEGDQSFHFLTADTEPTGKLNGQTITNVWKVDLNQSSYAPWSIYMDIVQSVTHVVFEESFKDVKPTNCYRWFYYFTKPTEITNLDYLDTSEVTNMDAMFVNCESLTTLDLSSFNTSNVTSMNSMFFECIAMTSLNLSNFNTSNVTDMGEMFKKCSSLSSLDLSNFDTSNVTNMKSMFDGCSSLTSLNLSSFDTSNVTSMMQMFKGCSSLPSLNLTGFNTSGVTDMRSMFYGCSGLTSLNLTGFNTSKVTDMWSMFYDCSELEKIYVSDKFTTSAVTSSSYMFDECKKLRNYRDYNVDKEYANYGPNGYFTYFGPHAVFDSDTNTLTFKNGIPSEEVFYTLNKGFLTPEWSNNSALIERVVFDESFADARPISCYQWFSGCRNLTAFEGLENLNTSEVTNMESMFESCRSLTSLDLSRFDTSNVTTMLYMFYYCAGLTSLDLSSFDTSKLTDMHSMFDKCSGLTSLDLSRFDTSNVTNMNYMFRGCSTLNSINLSSFNTSNVTMMISMFDGCSALTSLDLSSFNTSNVTDMTSMFESCTGLISLDLSSFDTSTVTDMRSIFLDCIELTSLDLSSFDTSNVTDMESMFYNCGGLTSLDLSSFNTSNVTNMNQMFAHCGRLEKIYVSDKFTIAAVTTSSNMFNGCEKLRKYNSANVDAQYANYGPNGYFTYFGPHVVFDSESKTLTFKNGAPEGSFYIMNQGIDGPEWSDNSADIKKVVFDESFQTARPTSCDEWFYGCNNLTEIVGMEYLNTSEVTYMYCMFFNCSSLTSLDLSHFDTSKVKNMYCMFEGCDNLTTLYLTKFDFSLFTSIDPVEAYLFSQCDNLRLVDLSESKSSSFLKSSFPQNALVYVPEGTVVADDNANVVVGETCAHFVINYGDTENNQNLLNIPYGFTADKVTINRKFEKGTPYSLFLPFEVSAEDYGTFYTYAGYKETSVQFEPVTETTTTANTPYMLLPTDDSYANGIVIEGSVTVETTPENVEADPDGYVGVYEKKTFTEEEANTGLYYGWAGTDFRRAGAGASVDACRAYFKLPSGASSSAPARIAAKFGDNATSGISDVNNDDKTTDSPSYNLNGQRVNDSYRGLIIKNGKKIISTNP